MLNSQYYVQFVKCNLTINLIQSKLLVLSGKLWYNMHIMTTGNVETAPQEVAPQAVDLSFLEANAIDQLRKQQESAMDAAALQAVQNIPAEEFFERGLEAREEARAGVAATIDEQLDAYLRAHQFDEVNNPDGYLYVRGVLKTVSAHMMDAEKWNLGDRDEQGKHTRYETSGRYQVEQMLERLRGADTVATQPEPAAPGVEAVDPEALRTAEAELANRRDALAALSVQLRRKARKGGKKSAQLQEQYVAAQRDYEAARVSYGALLAQGWQHEGTAAAQTRLNVVDYILDEHQAFTKAELQQLNEDPSRKARVSRFLARHHALFFGGSVAAGFGIGYGIGKLAKGTVMSAIGLGSAVAVPAAIAGGIAIKTTKSVLQASVGNRVSQIRSQEKRAKADNTDLAKDLKANLSDDHSHEELTATGNRELTYRINDRVNKDVRNNRNRVIGAALLSGAAGAAGFLVSSEMDHSWPFGHHDHTGGGNGGHETPPKPNYNDTIPPNQNPAKPGTSPYQLPNGGHTPPPSGGKGLVDGYNPNVRVEHGNGYIRETQQLAAQKGVHLSNAQATDFYNHEVKLHGAHVKDALTNDHGYNRSTTPGDYGISRPNAHAHWASWWIHDLESYQNAHDLKSAA